MLYIELKNIYIYIPNRCDCSSVWCHAVFYAVNYTTAMII